MSNVPQAGGPGESDNGAQENPLAVWLRNVPTWLVDEQKYGPTWYINNFSLKIFQLLH